MGVELMSNRDVLRANAAMLRLGADAGEFSWGSGLTPPGLEDAVPSEGGRYRGKAPKLPATTGSGLRALADELAARHAHDVRPNVVDPEGSR
ncbi:hypothetical protein [Gordonia sputi]|uniref:hypothetical protein n=1 Tax=Gordonia sputi TaxID=36823 RepID=UPI00226DC698|nr:hypothetical protein [Gordonia sputi]